MQAESTDLGCGGIFSDPAACKPAVSAQPLLTFLHSIFGHSKCEEQAWLSPVQQENVKKQTGPCNPSGSLAMLAMVAVVWAASSWTHGLAHKSTRGKKTHM